ncbi:hypothetical protein BJ085DRAFT_31108 [Dimargaris cristalligena]|uniref:Uncharacterized protein n=1 Tax=Dimargaris cristalligena TaxID=215637 RepID=A0A4P9ZPK7_9FUNG|nr:hypothetical protein BJ085DRAFT_31108 [Dimargaris cristalligena]|eukprot:RKP34522.1 hypothetical protein BJ085DRAFT_31108 [Dimargaris cristalligena]
MAYLALKGYHVLFCEFVTELAKTQAEYGCNFGLLAVILGAMTGQVELVKTLPHDILGIHTDFRTPPTMLRDNGSIAKVMRQINLVKTAAFLETILECSDSGVDQLPEEDSQTKESEGSNSRYLRGEVPQMGVPVIISEFSVHYRTWLTDLGPWEHDYNWKVGELFLDQRPDRV